ncbi:hypothetical protein ACFLTH_14755 [Bacteroidota bacterium]
MVQIIEIIAAVIAALIMAGMTIFQSLLVLGFPYGNMAWGGKHKILPKNLRIGSLVSVFVFIYAFVCVLERAGFLFIINNDTLIMISLWCCVVIFSLSTLGNITSKSNTEKKIMTPVAVSLTICCAVLAIL